jgi:hypothetical protein
MKGAWTGCPPWPLSFLAGGLTALGLARLIGHLIQSAPGNRSLDHPGPRVVGTLRP